MEHAPLRPLPSRSTSPADPELARRYVGARLPGLDEEAVGALALVELAHVERDQAGLELGLGDDGIGSALARARKELRRSRHALAGSGWCERAERLISDRLDGDLASPGRERLDAHLRNCPRCVEHELRLAQELDALAEGMPAPAKPAAALRLVVPSVRALPPGSPPEELEAAPEEPALDAGPEDPALEAAAGEPALGPAPEEPALEAPAEEPALEAAPEEPALEAAPDEPALEPAPEEPALEAAPEEPKIAAAPDSAPLPEADSAPTIPPAPTPTPTPRLVPAPPPAVNAPRAPTAEPKRPPTAAPAPPPVAPRPLRDPRPFSALIVAFTWHIALALAVVLAVATIAVMAIGIRGGSL